jgi:hypothetical protein
MSMRFLLENDIAMMRALIDLVQRSGSPYSLKGLRLLEQQLVRTEHAIDAWYPAPPPEKQPWVAGTKPETVQWFADSEPDPKSEIGRQRQATAADVAEQPWRLPLMSPVPDW